MEHRPLADRMRPVTPAEFIGQEHLLGPGKALRAALEQARVFSMIFWGPPGSGKTTLAHIIARAVDAEFVQISAVSSGVKEVRPLIAAAQERRASGRRTILFIDEIHRFSKSQQDLFLPYVEDGTIILIGATTENPSFEVNRALLSRCRVFVLNQLTAEEIEKIIRAALADAERGLGGQRKGKGKGEGGAIVIGDEEIQRLAAFSAGDARNALNALEMAVHIAAGAPIDKKIMQEAMQRAALAYDKGGEEHYNIISALHKSMRGGNADAALYWLARMLEGGEDPLYVARRLIRFASEDVGLANSFALPQAIAAYDACHYIGMPECAVNLAQAVVYMAQSKKSNVLYRAYGRAARDAEEHSAAGVPLHLRNAPTKLMKDIGYGAGYKYTHDYTDATGAVRAEGEQDYFPPALKNRKYLTD